MVDRRQFGSTLFEHQALRLRVTAARLGEECMHIFGGAGYLVDETPIGRWWRDMKLARIGGGTDEVLWELVTAAMKPDYDGYNELMGDPPG
jgi:alkylation response protein AidB-like acyl-CoA dehydrogenase